MENNPIVRMHFIQRDELTPEMHIKWMENEVYNGSVVQYIIHEKERNLDIGTVYLKDINRQNRSAEFGIFIGEKDAIGLGYGREAAKLIVQHGFRTIGLHRIFLRVLAENHRAIRCYQSIGFLSEGIAKEMVYIDNTFHDVVFMSVFDDAMDE